MTTAINVIQMTKLYVPIVSEGPEALGLVFRAEKLTMKCEWRMPSRSR
jgi:hypothetical protein